MRRVTEGGRARAKTILGATDCLPHAPSVPLSCPRIRLDMPVPVTAKLSKKFYDRFGDEIANELVDWFNQVDATYRSNLFELNEVNFARFEAKLEQRLAELEARVDQKMTRLEARIDRKLVELEARIDRKL